MELVNRSGVCAGWTMGFDRDGRELLVIAIKATFVIPRPGEDPYLDDEQAPLVTADTFSSDPGASAPVLEVDYAHRKAACDVLLNGTAYAPAGRAVTQVAAGLKVGSMAKAFRVVGHRHWRAGLLGNSPSGIEAFTAMPISYDNAFGGIDTEPKRPDRVSTYLLNPVGKGFAPLGRNVDGRPLPNTEELDKSITSPAGQYRPMALGAIGRNWLPRLTYAGTYDDQWVSSRAPFWPDDFDDRYFQAAPADQQIPFPIGGEEVILRNLTADGQACFRLPAFAPPVLFLPRKSAPLEVRAVTDTLLIEPDRGIFSMTARASLAMRKSVFDLSAVIVGQTVKDWLGRQRFGNKPYYRNLAELVQARNL